MRDSRPGTHGGLALIFVLLAKVLVVSELALRGTPMLAALAAACVAGRGTAVLLMYRHRYAREEGLGNVFIGKVTGRQTCITLGFAAIPLPCFFLACAAWRRWLLRWWRFLFLGSY